jgi:hypothetical protein
MREGEAFSLLTKGVPGLGTGQVRQVAGHLGEWPLPLQLAAAVMRERVLQGESTTHAGEQLLKIIERKGVRALEDPSAERHHRNNGLGLDTGVCGSRRMFLPIHHNSPHTFALPGGACEESNS